MATIEERAKEHYPSGIGVFTPEGAEFLQKAYIKGATEQREIDIEKACNEFSFFLDRLVEKDIEAFRPEVLQEDVKVWFEEFRKAMMEG